MSETPEAEIVANLATAAADPHTLVDGHALGVVIPHGYKHEVIDLERYGANPGRAHGTVLTVEPDSFLTIFNRHGNEAAFLYADKDKLTVTAVFNDDQFQTPGWRDHRAVLALRPTLEWLHWAGASGKLMDQAAFAEHIEAGLAEIREPDAASMLELAQTFEATTKAEFKSATRLTSGQRAFSYVEAVNARAGGTGELEVPETFTLGIAPFAGAAPYRLMARLRFRLDSGALRLGYRLERPHEVMEAAFDDVTTSLLEHTSSAVVYGTPPPARAA